jgi:hypothetical protein
VPSNVETKIELHEGSADKRVDELEGEMKTLQFAGWLRQGGENMDDLHKEFNRVEDRHCVLVVKSSWLQIQSSRVRFPVLPHFLRSSGSGTGSTQPRDDN